MRRGVEEEEREVFTAAVREEALFTGLPCEEEEKDVLCRMADCVEASPRRVIILSSSDRS